MKDYHINIFYSEADGGYIADIPDLDTPAGVPSKRLKPLAYRGPSGGRAVIDDRDDR